MFTYCREKMNLTSIFNNNFLAFKMPGFQPADPCRSILHSPWTH